MSASGNKRVGIIQAALEIINEKGFADSNISEIARKVGIADSVIYHYFKGKEDLLFHILAEKLTSAIEQMSFHLKGIRDPLAKLSKMIWFQMYLTDEDPEEAQTLKTLLFESRSHKQFYQHQSYQVLRRYTAILSGILAEGMDSGAFSPRLNIPVTRDMLFGLLDEQSIYALSGKGHHRSLSEFDAMVEMVTPMLVKGPEVVFKRVGGGRDQRILDAAEDVFAEKGFKAATVVEVAKRGNVAEGTIYSYYNTKKELLFNLAKDRLQAFREELTGVFDPDNPLDKLKLLTRQYMHLLVANRDFVRVYTLDIKLNPDFYMSDYFDPDSWPIALFDPILDQGREDGLFRKSADNLLFKRLVAGTISHMATRWFVVPQSKPIDMMAEIEVMISMLSKAITE